MAHVLPRENESTMNFVYLASFQAIWFVDRPVPKTMTSLYVRWAYKAWFLLKTFFTEHHILYNVRRSRRRSTRYRTMWRSCPQFPRSTHGTPGTMTPLWATENGLYIMTTEALVITSVFFFVGVSYRKGLNLERQSTRKEAMLLSAVDEEAVIKSVGLLSDRSP